MNAVTLKSFVRDEGQQVQCQCDICSHGSYNELNIHHNA